MAMTMATRKIVSEVWRRQTHTYVHSARRLLATYCGHHYLPSRAPSPMEHKKFVNVGLAGMGMQGEMITIAKRWMSCCSRLDSPPPRQVIVEYSTEEDNTDYFIKLADAIEEAYPEVVVLGNPEDMQSRRGSFEVTIEGRLLFSKLKENRLPKIQEILVAMDALTLPCQEEARSSA